MGHQVDLECYTIINIGAQGGTRTIKDAMYIWVNNPSLTQMLKFEAVNLAFAGH